MITSPQFRLDDYLISGKTVNFLCLNSAISLKCSSMVILLITGFNKSFGKCSIAVGLDADSDQLLHLTLNYGCNISWKWWHFNIESSIMMISRSWWDIVTRNLLCLRYYLELAKSWHYYLLANKFHPSYRLYARFFVSKCQRCCQILH